MGRGKFTGGNMREIDETRGSASDDAFEAIITKVEAAGGEIVSDETHPLYTDIGMDEFEIGHERIIEFSLNSNEFQLIRKVEECRITGAGRQKSLEELSSPRSRNVLKRKVDGSWVNLDLEDMF